MNRVSKLTGHLSAARPSNGGVQRAECSGDAGAPQESDKPSIEDIRTMMEDKTGLPDRQNLLHSLPGPFHEGGVEGGIVTTSKASLAGTLHHFWESHARKGYGGDPAGNIAFPTSVVPQGKMPYLDTMLMIADPSDAQRMARTHVRKAETYGIAFLGKGVLSTRDIDDWKEQREHLSESFLPIASLSKVFPISKDRAIYSAEEKLMKMAKESPDGKARLDLNEFLLYEAMAQLQLTLLGESEEYMEQTNCPLRQSFSDALTLSTDLLEAQKTRSKARKEVHQYSNSIVARSSDASGCPRHAAPSDVLQDPSKSITGPVMARVADVRGGPKVARDNASTVLFAGHDTTSALMTHFIYYVVTNPGWQAKIQAESDRFMAKRDRLTFSDLDELVNVKNCIAETLRLSPSVPNGTFREVQFDDEINGPNGIKVQVKKGQPFVVPAWNLHRSEALWGPDVLEFNPDREWLPDENYHGSGFKAYNMESHRYAPFTFGPRSCVGRPFALMEARLILTALFHNFTFEIDEPTKSLNGIDEISINVGTLQPKDGLHVIATPRKH